MFDVQHPKSLILTPLVEEWVHLVETCDQFQETQKITRVRVPCVYVPAWGAILGQGGNGRTQYAIQAQYLIDCFPDAALMLCVGTATSLDAALSIGDVVVATKSVEHDYRLAGETRDLPCFIGDRVALMRLREATSNWSGFKIAFDVVASNDADMVTAAQAEAIRRQTGALCVAPAGSGAARAAAFNNMEALEIRCITDGVDKQQHLPTAMRNVYSVLTAFHF
jgi:adenosylhomocysteine nucleosidase